MKDQRRTKAQLIAELEALRERTAEDLDKERAFTDRALNAISDTFYVFDPRTGKPLYWNRALCKELGYADEEVGSMPAVSASYHDEEDIARLRAATEKVLKEGYAFVEASVKTKDGGSLTFEYNAVLIEDRQGKPAVCMVGKNITERKQMEGRLRQSEKMEAVGQLAGGIAHDFNNQLAGILGYADLLRDEVGDDELLVRYAENILAGVKHASRLTAQLLAFSRQGKYLSTSVDLHKTIFEAVNILGRSIDKRIRIRQELTANPSTTLGDPTQLQNAVLNLALNARDAMPDGGELTFATQVIELDEAYCEKNPYEMAPGKYVQICVTDTGTGMDEETKLRIFEPFFTTKEQGKGTGMGLAAVYGTVKNHKGAIDVESTVGQGTVFRVYLPLVTDKASSVVRDLSIPPTVRGPVHVLLVEDEELVRDAAAEMLRRLSCKVTVCRDGAQAVDLYRQMWKEIDVVILDLVMPVMDGKDAFASMRRINPDIVALLASGYSLSGKAQTIIDEGAKGFIQKPFRRSELLYKISGVLNPGQ